MIFCEKPCAIVNLRISRLQRNPRGHTMFLYCFVSALVFVTAHHCNGQKSYDGWSLIKAHPANISQVEYLNSLPENQQGFELQVWQEGNLKRPFDIFLSPEAREPLLAQLNQLGIRYTTTTKNVQRSLAAERVPTSLRSRTLGKVRNAAWFSKYLTLSEIESAIHQLAQANPNIAQIQSIGETHLGRSIRLVKVSSNSGRAKPAIWIDGGIHAREWISPATVLYILNKLVSGYNTDSGLRRLVDSATWYIVPVLNPDGYEYTHTGNRMWRKNRRRNYCSRGRCCDGVDLNRNFGYDFGGAGTSTHTCSEIYRGPHAFSEPESQAVRTFVTGHNDIKAFLTLHSYSQMWFYPYGNRANSVPSDVNELKSVAVKGAKALAALYGTRYDVGTAANLLYSAAGGSDDWAKGNANIKYVYTLELRPSDKGGNGFILPTSQIVPTAEETWVGLRVVADAVIAEYGG